MKLCTNLRILAYEYLESFDLLKVASLSKADRHGLQRVSQYFNQARVNSQISRSAKNINKIHIRVKPGQDQALVRIIKGFIFEFFGQIQFIVDQKSFRDNPQTLTLTSTLLSELSEQKAMKVCLDLRITNLDCLSEFAEMLVVPAMNFSVSQAKANLDSAINGEEQNEQPKPGSYKIFKEVHLDGDQLSNYELDRIGDKDSNEFNDMSRLLFLSAHAGEWLFIKDFELKGNLLQSIDTSPPMHLDVMPPNQIERNIRQTLPSLNNHLDTGPGLVRETSDYNSSETACSCFITSTSRTVNIQKLGKPRALKHLSLVDCTVTKMDKLFASLNAGQNLQQFVVIFNTGENYHQDRVSQEFADEVLQTFDKISFEQLWYFEISFYNDAQHPFLCSHDVTRLVREMPKTVKEACIYSQDEVYDVQNGFITPNVSEKFQYLELGFDRLIQTVSPNQSQALTNEQKLFQPADKNRYYLDIGPKDMNQYGFRWLEFQDKKRVVQESEKSKKKYEAKRRGNLENAYHSVGIAFKELLIKPSI